MSLLNSPDLTIPYPSNWGSPGYIFKGQHKSLFRIMFWVVKMITILHRGKNCIDGGVLVVALYHRQIGKLDNGGNMTPPHPNPHSAELM